MKRKHFFLDISRNIYQHFIEDNKFVNKNNIKNYSKISNIIFELLKSDKPVMIGRLGAFELAVVTNYLGVIGKEHSFIKYITGKNPPWWNYDLLKNLRTNAGFFPLNIDLISRFCEVTIDSMKNVDVLASWLANERFFKVELGKAIKVSLPGLEPFWAEVPWSLALKGKRVVVVHPFSESIQKQYSRRAFLFSNQDVLPDFELRVIKAVQSLNGICEDSYADWFEALNAMETEIFKEDFDICLLGCGAYGFVLAANIKKRGKKAVHIGGALQLLFGIKGRRWDNRDHSRFYNEYWIRASQNETPRNVTSIEGGCYW